MSPRASSRRPAASGRVARSRGAPASRRARFSLALAAAARRPCFSLALAFLAALAAAAPAAAQQFGPVLSRGRSDPALDRRIAAILHGGRYTLLVRDTVIPAGDTLVGPVLAAGIRLRLDGVVVGDLVGVASDVFVHPGATVTGTLVNAGGGLYASSLARVTATINRPLARYAVTRTPGGAILILAGVPPRPRVVLDFPLGLHLPSYDRVDGLWLQLGAALRLPTPPALDSLLLHAVAGWRTAGPGLSQTVDVQGRRGRYHILLGEQWLTATPDHWIRGDLANSLSFFVAGNDYRDYYDARRLFAIVARDLGAGAWSGHVALRLLGEDAGTLHTRDVFVLFAPDSLRPNPTMTGRIVSAGAEATAAWIAPDAGLMLGGQIEAAGHVLGGSYAFGRYALSATAFIRAPWGHTLDVQARFQGPLASDSLPRQRWSNVGGPATLPTYPIAAFTGDRVVYLSSEYLIPLPSCLRLPLTNATPAFGLVHAAGMAWSVGQSPTLEQNLGAELRLLGLALSAYVNPVDLSSLRFAAGFAFNATRFPDLHPYFDTAAAER